MESTPPVNAPDPIPYGLQAIAIIVLCGMVVWFFVWLLLYWVKKDSMDDPYDEGNRIVRERENRRGNAEWN